MSEEFENQDGTEGLIELPIVPVRNMVLFPQVVVPLMAGREKSLQVFRDAVENDQLIAIVTQRDADVEDPNEADLYRVGTSARVLRMTRITPDSYSVIVQGQGRVRLRRLIEEDTRLVGEFEELDSDSQEVDAQMQALFLSLRESAKAIAKTLPDIPKDTPDMIDAVEDAGQLCDFVAANLQIGTADKQQILGKVDVKERIKLVLGYLVGQLEVAKVRDAIEQQIQAEANKNHREYFLRQQYNKIREQLGEIDSEVDELEDLETRIQEKDLPEEVAKVIQKQMTRLRQMPSANMEYGVIRSYVETLLDIPWTEATEDNLDIPNAREILDADHYGLEKVKERLVEFLAVRKLRADMKGPILCLVGPPGVGKTSLGKSVAKALGREFVRISLGGVHDEAEIRGHRRTYVSALPGRIVQALRRAGTINPVVMLDEIDKVGRDFRGDPQAALLEVLDPEQNHSFSDHYVELPVDLSKVLFIANANQADTISPPLRDRMEMIEIPGYTQNDKKNIVRKFLLPKQLSEHGIEDRNVELEEGVVEAVIDRYTREAGVRGLERAIADICRKIALKVVMGELEEGKENNVTVHESDLADFLGPARFEYETAERVTSPGIATGLAWTPSGGDILFIEATRSEGKGEMRLTGQLGDVMKESALAALSFLKMRAEDFGLPPGFSRESDIHIHFPAGAIPKDGPSAGIAIFTTLLSLFTGVQVRHDVAMTGEITLRGNVLPVGGIKEKTLAAHRAGIKRVILPERNRKDLVDVADEVKEDIEIVFVKTVDEVPAWALSDKLPGKAKAEKKAKK